MTDRELDTFIEASVKEMNDAWKGVVNDGQNHQ